MHGVQCVFIAFRLIFVSHEWRLVCKNPESLIWKSSSTELVNEENNKEPKNPVSRGKTVARTELIMVKSSDLWSTLLVVCPSAACVYLLL